MGEEVEPILAAIEDDNPGREIGVVDRGAYVRVEGVGRIVLTQETLRRHLGPDYEIRAFGAVMSAFRGRIVTTSDSITWENTDVEVRDASGRME
jgi:toluene monooxygenase system protein D